MSSVYEVRWRVLKERLVGVLRQAESGDDDETTARLAGGLLTLLDWHRVDGKGRCRRCRHSGEWWCFIRKQRCQVNVVLGFYSEQPMGVVLRRVGVNSEDNNRTT